MKRIAIISLLTLSISLTGCSSILKKLLSSDGSGVKFEEKGQKMDRDDWNDNFKKAVEDSNFESDNVPAFVISASSSSKQNNDESNGDYKVSEESSYSYKETYKYDDGKMLLSYVRSGTSNSTETSPYGKRTSKVGIKENYFYQTSGKTFYTIDVGNETYTTDNSSEESGSAQMNSKANSALSSTITLFALATIFADEEMEFYQNGNIFTITYSKTTDKDITDRNDSTIIIGKSSSTSEMTMQLNLTAGKNASKYVIKSSETKQYDKADTYNGYKAGTSINTSSTTSYNATINFKEQNLTKININSGYTKTN